MGVRIEHPRELIDKAQFGDSAGNPKLGAAVYKMACHPEHGRGAYTFCMCPGGTVVCASSEENRVVVNGMSEYARDGENSNSALLVGIEPENFGNDHPLAGIEIQRKIESRAFSSTSLSTLTWPSALETIDDEAFSGCKFENIVLPSRVTAIEKGAFAYNEQLKTITLPASLLTIEQSALQGCTHLESAVCESPVPPTTMGQEAAPQAILYVPEVAEDAYRAAPWWKDFKEIRAYVPSGIDGIVDKNSGQHPLYSIDGIKVSSTGHRGIMIRDGKKYTSRQ
jgi:hypothetical protein